ncbi:TPA: hypothetical protein EYO12_01190 [Candidatus Saccharibacteria bacterium]|nr:hypothetical protein [Candidatus Saccharibacteria bacterium]HIO87333.1 hypothetical protein [Candidatus Saccharibacteria bacterium]
MSLLIIAVLATLLFVKGPRVRFVQFETDPAAHSLLLGSTITVHFDRPLQDNDYLDQITFSPDLEFTATTSGQKINITLQQNPQAATTYSLKIGDQIFDTTDRTMKSVETYEFTTSQPRYMYLERNYGFDFSDDTDNFTDKPDVIKLAQPGLETQNVFEAEQISMFDANSDYAVVAMVGEEFDNLVTINLQTGEKRVEDTRFSGRVDNLAIGPRSNHALFTVTPDSDRVSSAYYAATAHTLFSIDLEDGTVTPLSQQDGRAIQAYSVHMGMFGQVALVQTIEQSFYAVSVYGEYDPVVIGSYANSFGFSDKDSAILFNTPTNELVVYDVASSDLEPIQSNFSGYFSDIVSGLNARYVSSSTYADGISRYFIDRIEDDGAVNLLWSNQSQEKLLRGFSVSYDESILALHVNPGGCQFDKVLPNPECQLAKTQLYDIDQSKIIDEFTGFDLVWLP